MSDDKLRFIDMSDEEISEYLSVMNDNHKRVLSELKQLVKEMGH